MTQNIIELENADLTLVEFRNGYPHCKKHGAMNTINRYLRDGRKFLIWRCVSTYASSPVEQDPTKRKPQIAGIKENACLAGCVTEVEG